LKWTVRAGKRAARRSELQDPLEVTPRLFEAIAEAEGETGGGKLTPQKSTAGKLADYVVLADDPTPSLRKRSTTSRSSGSSWAERRRTRHDCKAEGSFRC
jgi:hypothetical protein